MKAIIMAGGEGSRLRPLTCDCPKPMLRLLDKPLMEYAVELLRSHGVQEIAATLGYLPQNIQDYFGDRLHFYIEKTPLGTAGSVGQARDFLNQRFIVLSGDGITDIDLSAAVRFHEQMGALATLVLVKSASPQEYGMVVTDQTGRITSFHEKPGRSDVYSEFINTGIYVLEPEILAHIPENQPFDFGRDLFPALVQQGLPIYGYAAQGYWCDVGDVAAYLRVHADALDGKIRLDGLKTPAKGRCHIAADAQVAAGAFTGEYSCIGAGCFVAPGASIKRSILLPGARVEPNAQLRGCVVGRDAIIGEGAQLFEESVVGTASSVGERATLPPGVKLWPRKALPGGEKPEENIVWGSRRELRFTGGALPLEGPAQTTRAMEACVAQLKPRELLLGRGSSSVAAALWHAAAAGAMAQGAQIVDAGVCSLPQLRHALANLHADAAFLVENERLIPLTAGGAQLTERSQRDVLKLLERQDFAGPFRGVTRPMESAGRTDIPYLAETAAAFAADGRYAPRLVVCTRNELLLGLAERAFLRAGLQVRCVWSREEMHLSSGEMGIELSDGGEQAVLWDSHGPLDEVQRQLACAWLALEAGDRRLILPLSATRAIDALAERYGAHAVYLPGERALWMAALAEKAPRQFHLQFDGLYFALAFLSELTDRGLSLDQWRGCMPAAHRSQRRVQVPERESGRLLHALAQAQPDAQLGGGVRLSRAESWAWLTPDDSGAGLEIMAEGATMEAARELCDFYGSEIQRLLVAKRD